MKVLLVIDMLNDFVNSKGVLFCGKTAREIIPFVKKRIEEFHQKKGLVIFLCDEHSQGDPEFKLFPPHCLKGTWGSRIIKELPREKRDSVIKKSHYNGFFKTDLEKVLGRNKINEVEVVGVCTSICVMDTVGELRNREIPTTVWKNGVADFDPQAHKFALQRMEKIYGATVK